MKEIIKGSFFSLIFKGFGALSFFFLHVYISRTYGLVELGAFNMVLVILMIGSSLGKLGIDLYLVRKLNEYDNTPHQAGAFLREVFKIVFWCSVIISVVTWFILYFFSHIIFSDFNDAVLFNLIPVMIIVYTLNELVFSIFWGLNKINEFNFFKLFLTQSFSFFFIIGLGYFGWHVAPSLVYFFVLAISFITSFYFVFRLLVQKKIQFNKTEYRQPIIKKSIPMMVSTMMLILTLSVDRIMLSYYWDLETVGIFSAISKITFVMTFLPSIISSYIMPKIAKAYTEGNFGLIKGLYTQSLKAIILTTFPFLIIFSIYPETFLQLFNEEIGNNNHILGFYLFLGAYFVSGCLIGPLDLFLNMTDNQKIGQITIAISAIINLILNWLLIPKLSIVGAGIATFISFCVWQGSNYVILKQKKII